MALYSGAHGGKIFSPDNRRPMFGKETTGAAKAHTLHRLFNWLSFYFRRRCLRESARHLRIWRKQHSKHFSTYQHVSRTICTLLCCEMHSYGYHPLLHLCCNWYVVYRILRGCFKFYYFSRPKVLTLFC